MSFIWTYLLSRVLLEKTIQDFEWIKKEGVLIEHNLNEMPIHDIYYGLRLWN